MSEAPERLWVEPDGDDIIIHNGAHDLDALISTGYLFEYVRADHIEELRKEKMELRKWIEKNVGSDALDRFDMMMFYKQIFQKEKTRE